MTPYTSIRIRSDDHYELKLAAAQRRVPISRLIIDVLHEHLDLKESTRKMLLRMSVEMGKPVSEIVDMLVENGFPRKRITE